MQITITKSDLSTKLVSLLARHPATKDLPITVVASKVIVTQLAELMAEGLENEGRISLRELGVFERVQCPPKKARDIGRNKPIVVPAFTSVKFKPSTAIKRRLNRR